jgi:tol-pal system protein YbgF
MSSCWNCKQEVAEGSSNCPHCRVSLDESAVNMMATVGPGLAPSVQIVVGVVVNNRYEIRREIGRGGMGIVYLAFDRIMEREVAIKVIPQELCMDPRAVAELKRETGIAIDLTHANIVRLHTLDTWEGQAYVVMEYVGGGTLAHVLAKGVLSVEGALPILRQLAAALDYSHSAASAVIHRDLKPLNILLAEDGATIKVADFGLARVLRDSASRISGHDSAGTLAYMAPEQIRGKGIGRETDIYAFAAIVYEMLSGRPPFYTGDLRWQILHEEVEPIEGVPAHVNAALQRGLAKNREKRPGTAGELVALLDDEKLHVAEPKRTSRVKKPVAAAAGKGRDMGRPVLAVYIVIFITCVVCLGVAVWSYLYLHDDVRLPQVNADSTKPKKTSEVTPPATVALQEEAKGGRLTVRTSPAEATVRLLNISPAYSPGMVLDAGRYHVEVTAPGYERDARWVELAAGEDMIVDFTLVRKKAIVVAPVESAETFTDTNIMQKAQKLFEEYNYAEALKLFEKVAVNYSSIDDAGHARYMMGECLFQQREYDKAVMQYQRIISHHSGHAKVSAALLKQGMAFQELGDKETAKVIYKKLIKKHNNSLEAGKAREILTKL